MDHDDDTRIQDLRRAHDHAQDVESAIERSVGNSGVEWQVAHELVRLVGARLEARHDELQQIEDAPSLVQGKMLEYMHSGNFEDDMEAIGFKVDPRHVDLKPGQMRVIGPDGLKQIVTVTVVHEVQ